MSIRRLLFSLPLLILVIIATAWFWLLHTQSGSRWIWSQVESATDGSLSAASISGDLASGLIASNVEFTGDSVEVAVARVSLSVDIDLLPLRVNVLPATVSNLRIDLEAGDQAKDDTNLHDTLDRLQLPVELVFSLNGLSYRSALEVERYVKSLSRARKEALVKREPRMLALAEKRR